MNNQEVGTTVISGNLVNIGEILSVNLTLCKNFKFKEKHEIIKNKIQIIIPYYIAQFHDAFIKRYFDAAKKYVLDNDRTVFGLLTTGFILPFMMHVKIIPNLNPSIRFLGFLKKLDKDHSYYKTKIFPKYTKISTLLCNSEGSVFGISKNVKKIL